MGLDSYGITLSMEYKKALKSVHDSSTGLEGPDDDEQVPTVP